jgi:alpha-L-rhamnosidase
MHNHPVSNAFFVKDLRVLLFLAKRLGKKEDADRYEKQLALTKAAYVKKFIRKDGRMKNQYQGSYVMALAHVLEKGDPLYGAVAAHFIRNVKKNGLQTGFFATEHLLPLLCELNESKLAYDVLLSEKCPGWMYQVKRGATTTWERWDAIQEDGKVNESKMSNDNMVSFNHYSFGSVGEFYYRYILGIKPLEPGYKKALIKPYVDERLLYAKGSYESRSGKIVSSWKIEKDKVIYDFEVAMPAHIELEDGSSYDVKPGKHHFEAKKKIKKGERK